MMESGGQIYRARYQLLPRRRPALLPRRNFLAGKALEDWIPLRGERSTSLGIPAARLARLEVLDTTCGQPSGHVISCQLGMHASISRHHGSRPQ
jgi:hypothetical protein